MYVHINLGQIYNFKAISYICILIGCTVKSGFWNSGCTVVIVIMHCKWCTVHTHIIDISTENKTLNLLIP